jgi:hypothetical protein
MHDQPLREDAEYQASDDEGGALDPRALQEFKHSAESLLREVLSES